MSFCYFEIGRNLVGVVSINDFGLAFLRNPLGPVLEILVKRPINFILYHNNYLFMLDPFRMATVRK